MTEPTARPGAPDLASWPETQALDRSLVQGVAWTGGTKWVVQILSWASTLIVARLLTPGDFGLMGMATVYVGLVQLVSEFGLGSAIVQHRDLDESQIARLGGLAVLIGMGLCAVSAAVAGPVALFFGDRALRWIIVVLSMTFVTSAFQVMPKALLSRDLQFRKLAWIEGTEALVGTGAMLALAVFGFRYWALVLGGIIGGLPATLMAWHWRPHRLALPRQFETLARSVTFGWHLVVARVAWYTYTNADFAVVGRVLGKGPLGAYSFGWTIASIPVDRISALVGRVTPAVFAAVQDDAAALRRYLLGLTEGLALVTFPASVGLALVADQFVLLVLGEKWRAAIVPLRLLALYAGFRSVGTLFSQILVVTGHAKRNMQFSLLAAVVLPTMFYVGTHWGTTGVAMAWVVGYPLVVIPFYQRHALRIIDLRGVAYLPALWPALSGSIAMAAVVLGVQHVTPNGWPLWLQFLSQVAAGAITYAAAVWFGHRQRVRTFWSLLCEIRR